MALTALSVVVDLDEYSRFERERDTIVVSVSPVGAALAGEQVTVELIKSRRGRDEVTATVTLTLVNADPTSESIQIELTRVVDDEAVPKARRGEYFVRATSVTDTNITDDTPDFYISLVSVQRLKDDYLHGTDQMSSEQLAVLDQPLIITGVEITKVSRGHPLNITPLSYNYVEGPPVVRTLSWCGGPAITVNSPGAYTLRRGRGTDYIQVRIRNVSALPTQSHAEDLLIERKPFDEQRMRAILDQSISWLEDSALAVYLEPTVICTVSDPDAVSYDPGTDIPTFVGLTYDKKVDALMYTAPASGHWINFRSPYYPLIRFDELYGAVSNVRVVDIALEWVEIHERTGFVELVPFNQEAAFNFIGLLWVEALRGPVPIPNFWNFTALVGFRQTPAVLLELIAKKAAMDILTIAGQAFRGGFSSSSISRDGVSESVSYTASATFGIYSATIEDYRKWIEANLVEFRGAFRGPNMIVV